MDEKILVVDDDANLLKSIKKILQLQRYKVDTLINAQQVDKQLGTEKYHCLLLDVKMPAVNGMDIMHQVLQKYPALPVIMISGQSDITTAVQAIKDGAYDFIEKPIDPERLFVAVKNALQRYQLQTTSDSIFKELQENYRLIGESKALKNIVQQVSEVAATTAKVLILGESGTGKELVAWAVHYNSPRKGNPYIKLNCAAIPSELLESELFGHRKGAFTGAVADHKGKFIEADGGTLFLDEIGNMSLQLQAKLLRTLEDSEVEIIGENTPRKVDVRIVAATNRNLEDMIESGAFREDLFYRLNVVKITIPPLRERPEDILPLAYHFLAKFSDNYNKQVRSVKGQAEVLLLNYDWPGNVRQLRNTMEKLVLFSHEKEIGYEETIRALELEQNGISGNGAGGHNNTGTLRDALHSFEKRYILQKLQESSGKISVTARSLGIDRSNLFKKMRKYNINFRKDISTKAGPGGKPTANEENAEG